MKRAPNQPVSVEIKLTDDLFVKTAAVADAGTIIPTHAHRYDHITLLAYGSMRVEADGVVLGDYTGPVGILIRAGVKHTMTTLTDGVVFACIHALHGTDGVEIEDEHLLQMED
jgi:quercetin dioxygenase-like cupin family protein